MAGLDGKLQVMIEKQFSIREKLKPIDRRLKTLDEHLRHDANFKAYCGHKVQYEKLYAQYRVIKKADGFGSQGAKST